MFKIILSYFVKDIYFMFKIFFLGILNYIYGVKVNFYIIFNLIFWPVDKLLNFI